MKKNILLLAIFLILLGLLIIYLGLKDMKKIEETKLISPSPLPTPIIEIIKFDPLIELINIERKNKNLKPFTQIKELTILAQKRAENLYESGQWTHEGFDIAVSEATIKGEFKENLARGIATDSAILASWIISPTHADILFSDCKYAGLGRAGTGQIGELGADLYIILWIGGCK